MKAWTEERTEAKTSVSQLVRESGCCSPVLSETREQDGSPETWVQKRDKS